MIHPLIIGPFTLVLAASVVTMEVRQLMTVHQEELLRLRWELEHPGETFGQEPDWMDVLRDSANTVMPCYQVGESVVCGGMEI